MKTKTKKKIKHVLTKKKLVKKKASRRWLRAFFVVIMSTCTGSLAFAIATTQPPPVTTTVGTKIKPVPPVVNIPAEPPPAQVGQASWYALGLRAPDALTCASTKFPRGTYLQVKNLRNGRVVTCLVNDYGPEAWTKRVIDLSRGSFTAIESLSSGVTQVEVRPVPPPPASLNLLFPNVFSQVTGYQRCAQQHPMSWCDRHRQSTEKLK
ncbi:MAG TPA: septal ring lytic transglycosylase RlpA family protein [Candidatus Saccharimonadales bacterium]|nr:septal ring lytic transglycosylase RlpA family protein [Candidatus Saccharimonadales bacterium]